MIDVKYLLNDGADVPEGTKVIECEKCHRHFAVPTEVSLMAGTVCSDCAGQADAEAAASAEADMKANGSDEMKAALGE